MPPSGLTKDQSEILKGMWERGMKSTKEKKKISKAIRRTGLSEKVIKVCSRLAESCSHVMCY